MQLSLLLLSRISACMGSTLHTILFLAVVFRCKNYFRLSYIKNLYIKMFVFSNLRQFKAREIKIVVMNIKVAQTFKVAYMYILYEGIPVSFSVICFSLPY